MLWLISLHVIFLILEAPQVVSKSDLQGEIACLKEKMAKTCYNRQSGSKQRNTTNLMNL